MNTLSWLEILTLVSVLIGTGFYHFGFAMGKEQAEINKERADRAACKSRHPAGKKMRTLRIVTEREDT